MPEGSINMRWISVRDRAAYLRLTGVLFLVFAAAGTISPLFSNYMQSLGAGTAQIGVIFACSQAAALASQYWWGRWSDRIGRRRPLVVLGTAGLALAYGAAAVANWYGWLYVTSILQGLSFAAYSTGALALIGDVLEDEEQRGRLMGAYRSFGSLAFALAALSGGLLADALGLRAPVVLAGLFYALGCLLVLGMRENRQPKEEEQATSSAGQTTLTLPQSPAGSAALAAPGAGSAPGTRGVLVPFLGLTFAWFLGMGSVVALWPVHMADAGHSQTVIGGLWGLAALGEVPCLMLAGVLAERYGRKWVIIGGVAAMACVYVAYTMSTVLAWLVLVQLVRSLAYSCFETPAMLYATELGLRQQRGRMAGLYNTATGVGGIVGSIIGGAAAAQFGLPAMFRGAALMMLLVALVAALLMPRQRREAGEHPGIPRAA
jgi:MFS family permease